MVVRKLCNLATPAKVFCPISYNKPFKGVVVRTASAKTAMVKVTHKIPQRIYGNYLSHNTLYMCHDEHELCNIGDEVMIQKSRPFSKRKHWKIHSWVKREPSAHWFRIHPEYNINETDKERLVELTNFDYDLKQEGFEFAPKEIFNIQEGLREAEVYPEQVKRTLRDQLTIATIVHRSENQRDFLEEYQQAKRELEQVTNYERIKRETVGLPPTWGIDDEPGAVTVARLKLKQIQVEKERHLNQRLSSHEKSSTAYKKYKGVPEDQDSFPQLTSFLSKQKL